MIILTEYEVRKRIKKYFHITELVGKRMYKRHGENAWFFLDYRALYALLIIRENLNRPITVNDWNSGGKRQQRGLRTIVQQMIKNYFYLNKLYVSMHLFGKAFDFDVQGWTAQQVRNWIVKNKNKFPFKIRLEDNVLWNHLDCKWEDKNPKVYLFQPQK